MLRLWLQPGCSLFGLALTSLSEFHAIELSTASLATIFAFSSDSLALNLLGFSNVIERSDIRMCVLEQLIGA